jgi:hypothetical protein
MSLAELGVWTVDSGTRVMSLMRGSRAPSLAE